MPEKQKSLSRERPHKEILLSPLQLEDVGYSEVEVETIMEMRAAGRTVAEIAATLGRSYWGIYDKIRRLRGSHQLYQQLAQEEQKKAGEFSPAFSSF